MHKYARVVDNVHGTSAHAMAGDSGRQYQHSELTQDKSGLPHPHKDRLGLTLELFALQST